MLEIKEMASKDPTGTIVKIAARKLTFFIFQIRNLELVYFLKKTLSFPFESCTTVIQLSQHNTTQHNAKSQHDGKERHVILESLDTRNEQV